jgi:hypothetical protein
VAPGRAGTPTPAVWEKTARVAPARPAPAGPEPLRRGVPGAGLARRGRAGPAAAPADFELDAPLPLPPDMGAFSAEPAAPPPEAEPEDLAAMSMDGGGPRLGNG